MKKQVSFLAVILLTIFGCPDAEAGAVKNGVKKSVDVTVGATKKGLRETEKGTKKGIGVTVGVTKKGLRETEKGTKKGIDVTVGATKKGIKETKKFFKKVF